MRDERKIFTLDYPKNLIKLIIRKYNNYYKFNDSDLIIFIDGITNGIEKSISTLSQREQVFIQLRYEEHKLQSEIAKFFRAKYNSEISVIEREIAFKVANIRRWIDYPDNILHDLSKRYSYIRKLDNINDINLDKIILYLSDEDKCFLNYIYKDFLTVDEAAKKINIKGPYYKREEIGNKILNSILYRIYWRIFYVEAKKKKEI